MKLSALVVALGITCICGEAAAEGPVVLDGWNRYQTKVQAARETKKGFPWGWYPKVDIYVLNSTVEKDDMLHVQHFKGRKKWGKADKCRLRQIWDKKRGVAKFECRGVSSMATNRPGKYSLKVSYVAVGADKTYKNIASFAYSVKKFKSDNRHVKRRFKPSSGFVVDHDFRIGEAWLSEVEKEDHVPTQLRLRTWLKYNKEIHRPKARCYLHGKKVAQSDATRKQTTIEYRPYLKANTQGKAIMWAKHYWHFYKFAARPPIKPQASVTYPNTFYLSKNPGKYRCVVTADGDKIAIFNFEVAADGKVMRPPCLSQTDATKINTLDSVHLISVKYGKGVNAKFNKRAFAKSPMYGKKWPKGCPL